MVDSAPGVQLIAAQIQICFSGDVRPDQFLMMARAGIYTFDFPNQPDEKLVRNSLSGFTVNHQPSYELPIAG